jgi:hypothetical protein
VGGSSLSVYVVDQSGTMGRWTTWVAGLAASATGMAFTTDWMGSSLPALINQRINQRPRGLWEPQ